MSAQLAIAEPRRIKATHRRRRKVAAGPIVQRYYDPAIGGFLSGDPVATNPNTGANFCRYCYAGSNPYKFTDPDGRAFGIDDAAGFVVGAVVGVVVAAVVSSRTDEEMSWGTIAGAALSGGIAGVGVVNVPETGGLSIVAAGALNGAVAAGAGDALKQTVDLGTGAQKGGFSGKELAVNTVAGAVVGGAAQGALPKFAVAGVSAGRGNMAAAAKSVLTRGANMSAKTAVKGAVGRQTGDAFRTIAGTEADRAKAKVCASHEGACQ